jgi:hypothetical protein
MWIDLGNCSFLGMNLPAGGKSKASKLPEYTWGTWALGGICGVACGVLAMEKPVRQAINRTGATSVWTDNGSVDCDKRSCFIGEVPLHACEELRVSSWISKIDYGRTSRACINDADSVRFLISPREVNPQNQH